MIRAPWTTQEALSGTWNRLSQSFNDRQCETGSVRREAVVEGEPGLTRRPLRVGPRPQGDGRGVEVEEAVTT